MLMNIRCSFEAQHGVYLLGKHLYNYNDHAQNTMNRFKRTPEYEAKFINLITKSIPIGGGNSKYMKACNAYAFQILLEVFDNKINLSDKREWIKSDFYNTLFSNIKKYGNPTTRFGLAKIKYTSVFARFIIFLPFYLNKLLKRR